MNIKKYDLEGEVIRIDEPHALIKATFFKPVEEEFSETYYAKLELGGEIVYRLIKTSIFSTRLIDETDAETERYLIVEKVSGGDLAVRVVSTNTNFELFYNNLETLEKNIDRAWFVYCEGDELKKQLAFRTYESAEDGRHFVTTATSLQGLKKKAEFYRSTYPLDVRSTIEELLATAGSASAGSSDRAKALRRLRYILNIRTYKKPVEKTKTEIADALKASVCGMDDIADALANIALAGGKKRPSVLLIGPHGSAKTRLIRAFADAIKRTIFTVQGGAIDSRISISGDSPQYDASDAGLITKALYQNRSTDIVIAFENIDKLHGDRREGDPRDVLFDLLSEDPKVYDNYLECSIDTSSMFLFATAVDEEDVGQLRDRFDHILRVPRLSDTERVTVIKKHVLPEISGLNVTMSDDATIHLLTNFCGDAGVVDAKKYIQHIVRQKAPSGGALEITSEMITEVLDPIVDENLDPVIYYQRRKQLYSKETREFIETLVDKREQSSRHEKTERQKIADKQLYYLSRLLPRRSGRSVHFDADSFLHCLDKSHYGLHNLKRELASIFYAKTIASESISSTRILLVGDAGVGKTSIIQSVAEALNIGYVRIPLNGMNLPTELRGSPPSYQGSDSGILVTQMAKVGTASIIHLDEIDKITNNAVSNALIDLLDDSSSLYQDAFLPGIHIDISNCLFFATANDLSAVNAIVRDRFRVVYIGGYSEREKRGILKDHLIPKHTGAFKSRSIIFDEDTIGLLVKEYCTSSGVRDLNKATEALVRSKLFETRESKDTELVVNTTDVIKVLGHAPKNCVELDCDFGPGFVKALAIGQGRGLVFGIETVCLHDRDDVIITGSVDDSVRETIELSKTYIATHYPGKLKGGFHIHFGTGISTIEKHGASAGVAIVCSIFSAMTGINIDPEIAMTGEISLNHVWGVGGVKEKLWAAYKAGCKKMLIPRVNYEALKIDELPDIEIIPVSTIEETIDICFGKSKGVKLTA